MWSRVLVSSLSFFLLMTPSVESVAKNGKGRGGPHAAKGHAKGHAKKKATPAEPQVKAPKVNGFEPKKGLVDAEVTIRGANFTPADRVLLGSTEMKVVTSRPDQIQARVPAGAKSGKLTIQRAGKVVAKSKRSFVVTLPPPEITGFSPSRGGPGTVVRVTGKNFSRRDMLMLGGRKLALRRTTPTLIQAVIGKQGTGRLVLRGPGGRRAVTSRPFTVVQPPKISGFQPAAGAPGSRVQLRGAHFNRSDRVFLNNRALKLRKFTSTHIIAQLPQGATTGRLSLRRGRKVVMANGVFYVEHRPSVASFSPKTGATGTTIRIRGKHFKSRDRVLVGGADLPIVKRLGATEILARVTAETRSGPIVVATQRRGSARSASSFIVKRLATMRGFFPSRGARGSVLRIQGKNFDAQTRFFLGKAALTVTRLTPRQVWAKVPSNASSGKVIIETHGQRVAARGTFVVQ